MDEKYGFSGENMKEAMMFANSDAGKQLFELLQRTQGRQLQSAMDQAAAGDYDKVRQTLSSLMADPEARKLLGKMGK